MLATVSVAFVTAATTPAHAAALIYCHQKETDTGWEAACEVQAVGGHLGWSCDHTEQWSCWAEERNWNEQICKTVRDLPAGLGECDPK